MGRVRGKLGGPYTLFVQHSGQRHFHGSHDRKFSRFAVLSTAQRFSYLREGSTGRPNMERLGHLLNALDGLWVAFLSHFLPSLGVNQVLRDRFSLCKK